MIVVEVARKQRYRVEIELEDGWFIARVPELHAHTEAETWPELLHNLKEAIECALEGASIEFDLDHLVADLEVRAA